MKSAAWSPASVSFKTFVARSGRHISLVAPVAVIIATLAIWFAVMQAQQVIIAGRQTIVNNAATARAPKLNQHALPAAGYLEAISVLGGANPAVKVALSASKNSITVSVSDPALMPEWFYLLSTVQSYRTGLIWTAERICLKKCETGNAAFAELKAYTQEVSLNDLI